MFRARLGQIAKGPPLALRGGFLGLLCVLTVAYLLHDSLGRSGVSLALERLRSRDEDERVGACQALGQAAWKDAQAAMPELVRASRDPSPIVRREAIGAIMRIGLRSEVVLSSLAVALEDEDDAVRTQAARAVGMLGGDANSLAAQLIDTLTDRSPEVRAAAAVALGLVAPRDERVIAALVKALADVDTRVRRRPVPPLTSDPFSGEQSVRHLLRGLLDELVFVPSSTVTQAVPRLKARPPGTGARVLRRPRRTHGLQKPNPPTANALPP